MRIFRVDHYSSGMCNEYESCTRVIGPDDKTEDQFKEDCEAAKQEYVKVRSEHTQRYKDGMPAEYKIFADYSSFGPNRSSPSPKFLQENGHLPYREIVSRWEVLVDGYNEYKKSNSTSSVQFISYLIRRGYTLIEDLPDDVYTDLYWYRGEGIP